MQSSNEEFIARVLRHKESFYRDKWLEENGWTLEEDSLLSDGYRDPLTGELLDAETAFSVGQTRDILSKLGE